MYILVLYNSVGHFLVTLNTFLFNFFFAYRAFPIGCIVTTMFTIINHHLLQPIPTVTLCPNRKPCPAWSCIIFLRSWPACRYSTLYTIIEQHALAGAFAHNLFSFMCDSECSFCFNLALFLVIPPFFWICC